MWNVNDAGMTNPVMALALTKTNYAAYVNSRHEFWYQGHGGDTFLG